MLLSKSLKKSTLENDAKGCFYEKIRSIRLFNHNSGRNLILSERLEHIHFLFRYFNRFSKIMNSSLLKREKNLKSSVRLIQEFISSL